MMIEKYYRKSLFYGTVCTNRLVYQSLVIRTTHQDLFIAFPKSI